MPRPSRKLLYGTFASAVAVVGASLWLSLQEPHGPSRRLPDGTTVELAQVTFGREHRHLVGNFWQQLWARQARLPSGPPGIDTPLDRLQTALDEPVLWFHWRRSPTADPNRLVGRMWSTVAIDEHGCRLANDTASTFTYPLWIYPAAWSRNRRLPVNGSSYKDLRVYPRRSGRFRFAFLDEQRPKQPAAEFPVILPPIKPAAEWEGQRPPVTAAAGNVTFVLDQLRPGHRQPGLNSASAAFHTREAGKPTANWWPEAFTVLDATGNSISTENPYYAAAGRMGFLSLCPREPAWKVRVRFIRRDAPLSAASFVWKPPPLLAPPRDRVLEPGSSVRHCGVTLELTRVIGGGNVTWEGGAGGYSTPTAVVTAHAPDSRFSLGLISAHDEAGRALKVDPAVLSSLGNEPDTREFSFRYPQGTRRLHLTFGLFETHTVEFLAKPP